jgi:hypothetical protein
MNWYLLLPSAFAIYLLAISRVFEKSLRNRVAAFVGREHDPEYIEDLVKSANLDLPDRKETSVLINEFWRSKTSLIQNIALDWSARGGFFNSMVAASISVIAIYSKTQSFIWTVATLLPMLLIFVFVIVWITGLDVDELIATKVRRLNRSPAFVCRIILVLVHLGLMAAILFGQ